MSREIGRPALLAMATCVASSAAVLHCKTQLIGACFVASNAIVFYAAAISLVVVVALTIFAFQTKIDFTGLCGILFVALVILMVLGILTMIFPSKTLKFVYAGFGALLFSVYIIYDTQMMMGGSHKVSISPEEYIFAALNLYLDIVHLFMCILMLLGLVNDD